MLARLASLFRSGGGDRAADDIDEPATEVVRSRAALQQTRRELREAKTQLACSTTALDALVAKQAALEMERCALLLECHDGLLHPVIIRAEQRGGGGGGRGEEPTPLTAEELAEYGRITVQRRELSTAFRRIVGELRRRQDAAEEHAFAMRLRTMELEGLERRLEGTLAECERGVGSLHSIPPRPLEEVVVSDFSAAVASGPSGGDDAASGVGGGDGLVADGVRTAGGSTSEADEESLVALPAPDATPKPCDYV